MSDLSVLFGRRRSGFSADVRYVPDKDAPAANPVSSGRGAFVSQAGAAPAPALQPEPDPIAEACAQAYAQGAEDALARASAQQAAQDAARAALSLSFTRLDASLAETLRQRLLETVVTLCEATLQPLAIDTDLLAGRITRAVGMFSRADDERVIRLNPKDLDLVRPQLPQDWNFQPDPALERGAIRVETRDGGAEDGPAQWRQAITDALDLG